MGLGLVNVESGNWQKVRRNFARIGSILLGPDAEPTFSSLTLSGLTASSLIYPTSTGLLTSLGAATDGQIPIGSTGAVPVLAGLTGTANQVTVTPGAGSITLSLPQDIHTGASPTFAGLTLTAFTGVLQATAGVISGGAAHVALTSLQGGTAGEYYHLTSAEHVLVSAIGGLTPTDGNFIVGDGAAWVVESGNTARTSLGLGTGDSPTFTGVTITGNSVLGLDSSVFQPATDSTTFFQVQDAGGTAVGTVDTINKLFEIRANSGTNIPTLLFYDTDISVADDQAIGKISWYSSDASEGAGERVSIEPVGTGGFGGHEDLLFKFRTTERFRFRYGGGLEIAPAGPLPAAYTAGLYVYGTVWNSSKPLAKFSLTDIWPEDSASVLLLESYGRRDSSYYLRCYSDFSSATHFNITSSGYVTVGSATMDTVLSVEHATPYFTLHNSTHEDTDGGRESRLNFKGEQGVDPFEETTLARIEVSHDGSGADDKGKIVISVNDGDDDNTPTQALEIGSDLLATFAGAITGSNLSGTNTGDQTTIAGITGTKAEFDTACTDGDFMYVGGAPTAHLHDGDTLEHDGVNSSAGAFAFDTAGIVTFSNAITMSAGMDLTIAGHIIFNTNNSYIGFTDPKLTFDDTNNLIQVTGKFTLPDSGYLGCASDTTALQILPAGDIVLTDSLYTNAGLYILERAATVGAVATWGHIWVKNTAPTQLWFTDDEGNDIQLGTGIAAHAMLDGSVHTDTVADDVSRGSIIYGNSTPKWDELAIGVVDTFLGSDGTDLSYRTAAQVMASLSGEAGAAFSVNSQSITDVGSIVVNDDGTIGVTDGTPSILFDDTDGQVEVTGILVSPGGDIHAGVDGTTRGFFRAYGPAGSDYGGSFISYVSAGEDDTIDSYMYTSWQDDCHVCYAAGVGGIITVIGPTCNVEISTALTVAGIVTGNSTAVFEGASVAIGKASTTTGTLVLYDSNSANTVTIQAPDVSAGSLVFTLPATDGDNTNVLQTDGNGVLSWVAAGGAGADVKVSVDAAAAAGYIGAANSDGVLRAGDNLSYVDGGDFITLDTIQGIKTTNSPTFAGLTLTANSDSFIIAPDGTDILFTTSDGEFIFKTDEGTNSNTYITAKGKGTGVGLVKLYDDDDTEWLQLWADVNIGYISTQGSAPGILSLQYAAHAGVSLFAGAAATETPELKIYGYKDGDASRSLEIGVGVNIADTVSFDGLSNYMFDGSLLLSEKANANGDNADYGQVWVKSDEPNTLWFTDDAGTDLQLGVGLLGDGTAGRVVRVVEVKIEDGTDANTVKVTVISVWNGDTIAVTDNIVKNATTGNFSLSATGKTLTIEATGLTGNALMTFPSLTYHDASSTYNPIFVTSEIDANGIEIVVRDASDGVAIDWTAMMDDVSIVWTKVNLLYITSA